MKPSGDDVNDQLRAEPARRAEVDQAARAKYRDVEDFTIVEQIDAENTAWLKDLVSRLGWPLISQVGTDGAQHAWLLVQHADADPAFQRQCLDLMTAAAKDSEVTSRSVAYLTDRVLLAEGQPQQYGTQFIGDGTGWRPRTLADPEDVDQRRASMGLDTLAENTARILAEYGPAAPSWFTCPACGTLIEYWYTGETQTIACGACDFTAALGAS